MGSLRTRASGHAGILLVLGLAAVLRLGVLLAAVSSPQRFFSPDDQDYVGLATHLHAGYLAHAGHWFDLGLFRTPVYPFLLRGIFEVFGRHYAAVVAVHLVLGVATVGLVYWLGRMLLPPRAALGAALLLAIDPASIVFGNQMLTETPFALLLTLSVALVVLGRRQSSAVLMAAAGLLLGIAVLTRPVAEYLPLVLVPTLLVMAAGRRGMALVLSAALLVGFAIPVGGWLVRNHARTGVATISTVDGYDMLHYRAVGALVEDGMSPSDARGTMAKELAPRLHPGENAAEVSRARLRLGLHVLAKHPAGAAKSWARGVVRLLFGPARSETSILLTGHASARASWLRALVLVDALVTIGIVLAAVFGVVLLLARRLDVPDLWILAVISIYLVGISGGPEAYSRFRVPIAPLLVILAAAVPLGVRRLRAAMRPARLELATSAHRHSAAPRADGGSDRSCSI